MAERAANAAFPLAKFAAFAGVAFVLSAASNLIPGQLPQSAWRAAPNLALFPVGLSIGICLGLAWLFGFLSERQPIARLAAIFACLLIPGAAMFSFVLLVCYIQPECM